MPNEPSPLLLVTVPCRTDNYAFLLHNSETGQTALFDAPDAGPVAAELDRRGWTLTDIALTHHHGDHVEGVASLRAASGAQVIGAKADSHRLPPLDLAVSDGDSFTLCGTQARVIAVPGHTLGHIAYHVPAAHAAFAGDTLMAMGCGRLFEGTAEQMWDSLCKLRALPPETLICSGHEYTQSNGRFALSVEPGNADLAARIQRVADQRERGEATIPSLLADELRTNPFLRADVASFQAAVGLSGEPAAAVFAHVRKLKDHF
jgi:hydroxyacylglutathione hydrolase